MPSLVTPFNFYTVFDGIFVYLFSVVLYLVWSSLAFLDLVEEDKASRVYGWSGVILLVPFFGAAAYLVFGRSRFSQTARLTTVIGGLAILVAVYSYTFSRII